MIQLTVQDLCASKHAGLQLVVVSGNAGLNRRITKYRIQKSGLALTGLFENVHKERIQILGQNETEYLKTLPFEQQKAMLTGVMKCDVPCFILTRGIEISDALREVSEEFDVAVLGTSLKSSTFIIHLNGFLETNLAASTTLHGVLVDVLGVGVLIMGKSGVGKSECALELLLKGYRLVADDIVEVKKSYPATIWGSCSQVAQHHMEIRGLGIINVANLFGINSVRERKKIQLILELVDWDGSVEYDRLGLEHKTYNILEVDLPLMTIPVSQGRNMAAIVEVAARNHLLQERGIDSALSFRDKLDAHMIRERLSGKAMPAKKFDDKSEVE